MKKIWSTTIGKLLALLVVATILLVAALVYKNFKQNGTASLNPFSQKSDSAQSTDSTPENTGEEQPSDEAPGSGDTPGSDQQPLAGGNGTQTGGGGQSNGNTNQGGGTGGGNDNDDDPTPIAYANASNTGPTNPGAIVAAQSNTILSPGVYENLAFTGTVNIEANNVTLRNCTVTGGYYMGIRINDEFSNVTIEDCSLTGTTHDNAKAIAAWGNNITLRRLEISGYTDGISAGNGARYSTIWIHDLTSTAFDPHYDGIEIYGGTDMIIEYCTIDNRNHNQTSAINIANDFGSISNVTVRNNRLYGGGYTLYARGDQPGNGGPVTGISVQNNRFIPGYWGVASIQSASVSWTGNVHDTTGQAISP